MTAINYGEDIGRQNKWYKALRFYGRKGGEKSNI